MTDVTETNETTETTDASTALAVVTAFHEAWTSGDVERAMTYVSEDVVYVAPSETLRGREAVHGFLAGFVPMLTGVPDIARFADEDAGTVLFLYYAQTAVTQDTPAAEYFTVRDGLIVHDLLAFDRLAYLPPEHRPDLP